MTVTPVRMAMTSPTVPMQQKSNSRISNFSVASLLADTRPKTPNAHHAIITSGSPTTTTPTPSLTPLSPLMVHGPHGALHQAMATAMSATMTTTTLPGASPSSDLLPANLSSHTTSSSSPRSQHDGSSSLKNVDPDRADTPHSLLESDDYDSNHDEEEDSIVDIEDMDHELSESGSQPGGRKGSGSPGSPSTLGLPHGSPPGAALAAAAGHVPIRPTPFSALAAAAAAWGGMSGGVPWPGARQMPPFGPPGLFPGQGFGAGQLGGGKCTWQYG
uniref:Uncharacterized protein n=1 Tax=Anopheles epiroticus TaxID=199890 RepID=A0A182P3Z4_9DIPT